MKAVHRLIDSIISYFNSYFTTPTFDHSTPECWPVHEVWPWNFTEPDLVRRYMDYLIYHYNRGRGVFLGPDDWYLSSAEAYKDKKSLGREYFVGTMRLTPRLSKRYQDISVTDCQEKCQPVQTDDSQAIHFIIEWGMDRNQAAVLSSGSGYDAPASRIKDGEDPKKIFKGLEVNITISFGARPARNQISLFTTRKGDYDLLGRIDFPVPSIRLLHEENYDAIFKALLAQGRFGSTLASSLSGTSTDASCLSSFISLPDLVCLADVISRDQKFYMATSEQNYYGYSSMIFFTLPSLASSNIVAPVGGGLGDITIGPHEPTEIIGRKFKETGHEAGHCGRFKIIGFPETTKIVEIIIEWKKQRVKMNNKIREGRLKAVRGRVPGQQKMEDDLRQAKWELEEVRQERRRLEEARQERQKMQEEFRQEQRKMKDEGRRKMEDEWRRELRKMEEETLRHFWNNRFD